MVDSSLILGVGLRPTHFPDLETNPKIRSHFFEAISENFMNSQGRPREILRKLRKDRPVALHGVSMNIASSEAPNPDYLKRLKALIEEIDPMIVSDHLCWTGNAHSNTHDLLPPLFNSETLEKISEKIDLVQNFLGRKILIENISYYLRWKSSDITEPEFLSRLCRKTGCGLLLDLNNIHVNSVNHNFCAESFLREIPSTYIGQVHIAGPSEQPGFLFDTHSTPVPDPVWSLLKMARGQGLQAPILLEWDDHIPSFNQLEDELYKAYPILSDKRDQEALTL